jgi:hypothetical protein
MVAYRWYRVTEVSQADPATAALADPEALVAKDGRMPRPDVRRNSTPVGEFSHEVPWHHALTSTMSRDRETFAERWSWGNRTSADFCAQSHAAADRLPRGDRCKSTTPPVDADERADQRNRHTMSLVS